RLWCHCWEYLVLVARKNIDAQLSSKISPSDVVQETLLEAQRDFAGFQGEREEELRAWLNRILVNNLANAGRQFTGTQMRAVHREVPLAAVAPDDLPYDSATASQQAQAQEQVAQLERAVRQLPDHYRTVLQLRYEQKLTFEQIAGIIAR